MKGIYIEGNKGGNYVKIEKLDDNRLHLEIGDCCVVTVNCILTAEVFSNALSNITLDSNKSFLDWAASTMTWKQEYNNEVLKGCVQGSSEVLNELIKVSKRNYDSQ